MKNPKFAILILATGLALFTTLAPAQSYSVDWHTIDGGGGTSTGGVFSVSGTLGQPDAGQMSGGNFSLTGGVWSLLAIQPPDAPRLTIAFTSTNTAIVSWPFPSTGFALQQNPDLNPANWTVPLESVSDDGTNHFILVNSPTGNRFYRLLKP
jgi:hypothetical protein